MAGEAELSGFAAADFGVFATAADVGGWWSVSLAIETGTLQPPLRMMISSAGCVTHLMILKNPKLTVSKVTQHFRPWLKRLRHALHGHAYLSFLSDRG